MGGCVIKQGKVNNNSNKHGKDGSKNDNQRGKQRQIIIEGREYEQVNDKKTARVMNKQSHDRVKKFVQQEAFIHQILITESTKQPESNIIDPPQSNTSPIKISLKTMNSFCQSVQKQFENFQNFSQEDKQQAYDFFKTKLAQNTINCNQNVYNHLDETSQLEKQCSIQINAQTVLQIKKTPSFLRKYLPLQELSIQIKYL